MSSKYVLAAFDNENLARGYFESAKVLSCDIVSLFYNPGLAKKVSFGNKFQFQKDAPYAGNTGRHRDLKKVLEEVKPSDEDWIIFTDVHDIRFQLDIPDLPENLDVIATPEGKTFGEIGFWKERYPEEVWEMRAHNAGTFAMRYSIIKDFWQFLEDQLAGFIPWYLEGSFSFSNNYPFNAPHLSNKLKCVVAAELNGYADTLYFNQFIRKEDLRVGIIPDLFACYAFSYELGDIVEKDGKTYTKDGQLVSVVHYNGNTKKYLKKED